MADTAILLDFNACQSSDCSSINLTEQTGIYSSDNSGGYGFPNFVTTDATAASIIVTLPSGTQSPVINVFSTFPDSTGDITKTITASDLGLTGALLDGIYVINYIVVFTIGGTPYVHSTVKTFFLSCSIKCCIDKMIAKIPIGNCDCNDKALKNALLAYGLYQSLLANGKCGNVNNVNTLLLRLNKLCSATSCGCNS